jgi:hypothetical protein
MADRTANLVIRLKDMASEGVNKFKTTLGGLKESFVAVSAGVAAVIAIGLDAMKAYAEQEAAVSKLEQALRNQGLSVEKNSKQYQAYAAELQKTTTFSDEVIIETQAMLTTFGIAGNQMNQATKAALDLSTGLGIDLKTATMLMGKAAQGETGTLAKFGIKINENIPAAEKFAAVLDVVGERFGGSAQAAALTLTGRMEVLKNRVGELKELLGAQLLPVFEVVVGWFGRLLGQVEVIADAVREAGSMWTVFKMAMLEAAKGVIEMFVNMSPLLQLLKQFGIDVDGAVKMANAALDRQIAKVNEAAQANMTAVDEKAGHEQEVALSHQAFLDQVDADREAKEADKRAKELAAADQQTAALMTKHQTRAQMMIALQQRFTQSQTAILMTYLSESEQAELLDHAKKLEALGKYNDAQMLLNQAFRDADQKAEDDRMKAEQERNKERMANFQSTLQFITSLSQSKSKELVAIGKAAAIANATMDTFAAATKALTIPPPWVGIALAATVTAAGLANVARISGVKMADGGIVMPRPGGIQATIGEAGSPEAVIPLDDERATSLLGGGKSETHIHFHGPVIADRMAVRDLARMIDEEIYKLQKNRVAITGG